MEPRSVSSLADHPLSAFSLFKGAGEEAATLLRALRPGRRVIEAGAVVFVAGDEANDIHFLARLQRNEDPAPAPLVAIDLVGDGAGQRLRLARIVEGELFGELELLRAGLEARASARLTEARAMTPALVWSLRVQDLARLVEVDAAVRGRFLRIAAGRLLDTIWGQHSRSHLDPEIVLADWLVELAADLGQASGNRVTFAQRIAQTEIAAELGMARETINRRLKEWERAGLVATGAQSQRLEVLDYDRIVRIASLRDRKDASALRRALDEIDHDMGCGNLLRARNVALDMLRHYPSSPHLLHRLGLATARGGHGEETLSILRRHRLLGGADLGGLRDRVEKAVRNPFVSSRRIASEPWIDDAFADDDAAAELGAPAAVAELVEDVAALEARLLKDGAFEHGENTPCPEAAMSSHRAYNRLYLFGNGHYAGVNAAAMAMAAGRREEGMRIARELIGRLSNSAHDYWSLASLGEALLICGQGEQAKAALSRAARAPGATDGAKASTALQLRRLGPVLGFRPGEWVERLAIGRVGVVSGHMFRGATMDHAAQQAAEQSIREQTDAVLAEEGFRYLYGPLACGGDIILAEAALEAGAAFHAVLPFAAETFCKVSVDVGDPPQRGGLWRRRFERVLDRASGVSFMSDHRPLDRDLDGYFFYGFRFAAGLGLLHAATLQSDCALIAVSDGKAADNIAGTNRVVADWLAKDRCLHVIAFPRGRRSFRERPRAAASFRPLVFLWPEPGTSISDGVTMGLGLPPEAQILPRRTRSGVEGAVIVATAISQAIEIARAAVRQLPGGAALQAVADFGPVLGRDLAPDNDLLARVRGASELAGFPSGEPLATPQFAAHAFFELDDAVEITLVGRSEVREDSAGDPSAQPLARARPSIPIYRIALT